MGGPIHNQHTVTVMANTRVQQQTLVDANLPDNSTNLITPEKHREVETESISASAFVDDDNTFTGNNEFEQPIIVGEATISAAVGSSNFQAGLNAGNGNTGTGCNQIGGSAGGGSTGDSCNQIGNSAGGNNTGSYCNQIGGNAGNANTGAECVQIGSEAGRENTGDYCNQIGYEAGRENDGDYTNLFGHQAGKQQTGGQVTAVGTNAAEENTQSNVIAIGEEAGKKNASTGNCSTFIGKQAGFDPTSGLLGSGCTAAGAIFAISLCTIPSFEDKNAADAAITIANGYVAGSAYLYLNEQHGWIGYVIPA
jgi:hypothetical protein